MLVEFKNYAGKRIAINPDHVATVEETDESDKTIIHLVTGEQRGVLASYKDAARWINNTSTIERRGTLE